MSEDLLLHICCGPCASAAVERLQAEGFRVIGYFSNSNIQPRSEYQLRLESALRVARHFSVELIEDVYEPEAWMERVRKYADAPEGGSRCELCYAYRMERTARYALRLGIPRFTSTLTISPWKRTEKVHAAGQEASRQTGVPYLCRDFKKKAGFERSVALSKELGLYRQRYCGCLFSLRTPSAAHSLGKA